MNLPNKKAKIEEIIISYNCGAITAYLLASPIPIIFNFIPQPDIILDPGVLWMAVIHWVGLCFIAFLLSLFSWSICRVTKCNRCGFINTLIIIQLITPIATSILWFFTLIRHP